MARHPAPTARVAPAAPVVPSAVGGSGPTVGEPAPEAARTGAPDRATPERPCHLPIAWAAGLGDTPGPVRAAAPA